MTFEIVYHPIVVSEDIPLLPAQIRQRIRQAIEEKLISHPELFGKPLRQALKGYRRLRVGDYRVVFRIEKKTVKIFIIGHRSFVYEVANKRV